MATSTPNKVSRTNANPVIPAAERDAKVHTGPVARLLAKVSRMGDVHAKYKLDKCTWRELAL